MLFGFEPVLVYSSSGGLEFSTAGRDQMGPRFGFRDLLITQIGLRLRFCRLNLLTCICAAIVITIVPSAYGHPGGLNSEGCHTNRKTGEYHCHRKATVGVLPLAGKTRKKKSGSCEVGGKCEGCGCKGGPGYRSKTSGECVGFKQLISECGNPPSSARCVFENAPGTGANRVCVLGQ